MSNTANQLFENKDHENQTNTKLVNKVAETHINSHHKIQKKNVGSQRKRIGDLLTDENIENTISFVAKVISVEEKRSKAKLNPEYLRLKVDEGSEIIVWNYKRTHCAYPPIALNFNYRFENFKVNEYNNKLSASSNNESTIKFETPEKKGNIKKKADDLAERDFPENKDSVSGNIKR